MNNKTAIVDPPLKIILLGDSGTGKSTLFKRLQVDRKWDGNLRHTIGVEFFRRMISVSNELMSLQIWDLAGVERFRKVSEKFYRGNDAALVVYDITNENSFLRIESWLKSHEFYGEPDALIILVGNKCELEDERQVSYEEGRLLADKNGFMFFEVSAKTLENVDYLLRLAAKKLLPKLIEKKANIKDKNKEDTIVINSQNKNDVSNNSGKMSSGENLKKSDSGSSCNIW